MRRRMMKSKIHRATVTDANLDYVGSISLDPELMRLGDIREYEQVAVLDIDNGARFETYAILGGPGEVCLNGAAARLVHRGDKVIVITYADYEEAELSSFEPRGRARGLDKPVRRRVAPRGSSRAAAPVTLDLPVDTVAVGSYERSQCSTSTYSSSAAVWPVSRLSSAWQRSPDSQSGHPHQGRALPVRHQCGRRAGSRRSSAATRTRRTSISPTPSQPGAGFATTGPSGFWSTRDHFGSGS